MDAIRIAIAGVGNCASALLQGIEYYGPDRDQRSAGLMHEQIGGYGIRDVRVVAAFDVDRRKVGRPLHEAVFAPPNCTKVFCADLPDYGLAVHMGPLFDGVASHMAEYPEERTFCVADAEPCNVTEVLRKSGAEVLICYLPVGSEQATAHYAEACLDAGVAMVNCIPVFIASDARWAQRFRDRGLPIVGDDVKSQVGATIVHRVLTRLVTDRGARLDRTYQLNTGGNTDFLNMLAHERLRTKRISKTESVQSQLDVPLPADCVHIGPADYVPWQRDNKVCFLRMECRGFGDVPLEIELRLSVEDSPNNAGVAIDAIRCAKLALDRGEAGPIEAISAVTMKHPPKQIVDSQARLQLEAWLAATPEHEHEHAAVAGNGVATIDTGPRLTEQQSAGVPVHRR